MGKGYRSLIVALSGILALLAGMRITTNEKMYDSLMWGVVLITLSILSRSAVEALAKGGGVKGAVSVLMTDKKPGDPTP